MSAYHLYISEDQKDPAYLQHRSHLFCGQSSTGYWGKEIIRLIHSIQEMVNKDPDMDGKCR